MNILLEMGKRFEQISNIVFVVFMEALGLQ